VQLCGSLPFVDLPKRFLCNDSYFYDSYEDGLEIELIRIIGKSKHHWLLKIATMHNIETSLLIYIGGYITFNPIKGHEFTRRYLTVRYVWYTPCAVKYLKWDRFFKIFCVDLWVTFALLLVLGVIFVRYISRRSQKLYLNESKTNNNILRITTSIIAVLLISVCKHTSANRSTTCIFLLLSVFVCCHQHSVPGLPHLVPCLTRVRETNQNSR
jgi:hypothetical protein